MCNCVLLRANKSAGEIGFIDGNSADVLAKGRRSKVLSFSRFAPGDIAMREEQRGKRRSA
jgi:hypothetical protein